MNDKPMLPEHDCVQPKTVDSTACIASLCSRSHIRANALIPCEIQGFLTRREQVLYVVHVTVGVHRLSDVWQSKRKCLSITSSLLSGQSVPEPEERFAEIDIIGPPSPCYGIDFDIIAFAIERLIPSPCIARQ